MTRPAIPYDFEHLEVRLPGGLWSVTGSVVLELDSAEEAFPTSCEIEQLDRLTDSAELDFEDMPLSLLTPEEQLALIDQIYVTLDRDRLNQYYAERKDDYV